MFGALDTHLTLWNASMTMLRTLLKHTEPLDIDRPMFKQQRGPPEGPVPEIQPALPDSGHGMAAAISILIGDSTMLQEAIGTIKQPKLPVVYLNNQTYFDNRSVQ